MLYLLMLFSQYQNTVPRTIYSPSYTFLVYSASSNTLSISILKDFNAALVKQGNNSGFAITDAVGQVDNLLSARVEAKKNFISMLMEEKFIPGKNSIKIRMFYAYSFFNMPFYESVYTVEIGVGFSSSLNVFSNIYRRIYG